MLYNILGYEKSGTKKVYVRTIDWIDENTVNVDSVWTLFEEHGGGFYDCNTSMGEAYSHGMFENGFVQAYVMYGEKMSDTEKS